MDKKKLIYFAVGALFLLPSCSDEGPSERKPSGDNNRIYFRSYLPAVTQSRAGVVSTENFNTCQVTSFSPDDVAYIDQSTGLISPYFSDVRFEKDTEGRFLSIGDDCKWPGPGITLHFFAHYPSVDSMKKISGSDHFNLVNTSRHDGVSPSLNYRLEKFRVAKDIAAQSDFLTAYANGTLTAENSGVALDFKHQLARVELSAWGNNEKYDFEIAGVRIGNIIVEGDFDLSALSRPAGQSPLWINVSGHHEPVEHIFSPGESIVTLSKRTGSHNSENLAASVMGTAGPAMVIPMYERIEAWGGKNDSAVDKMYFSLLIRVTNRDNEVVYPYPNDRDNMAVEHFAVDNAGTVLKRLHKIDGAFYTTSEKSEDTLYIPSGSEKICSFGWASLPVAAKWDAGKIYAYKLNYTDGIGWHDPADPNPGEPIIERGHIPFEVNVEEWVPAEDYNSELDVPKR